MTTAVTRHDEPPRYELEVDGERVGVLDLSERADGAVVLTHTVIDEHRRGHGFGARLVRGALDDLRRRGAVVVPQCWFTAEFIARHPAYGDLLADRPDPV